MRTKIQWVFLPALLLLSIAVFAAQLQNSPSSCSGQWTNCANANANDASRATATATATNSPSGVWKSYGFSIPSSASIDSVIIRADFFATNVRGFARLRASGNGGASYGAAHEFGGNTAEQTFLIDVTGDLAWTPAMLNNGNLTINVTCFKNGTGTNPGCRLDWVPVNVTYTPFDFSVSVNPTSDSILRGETAPTTVTVTLLGGTSQSVTLSHSGCPPSATCSFVTGSGSPTFNTNLTVVTTSSTPPGTYPVQVNGTGDGLTRSATFTVTVEQNIPVADASANPTSGDEPLAVSLTGGVTGGDAPFTYFWNFADGTNSTDQNPNHTFVNNGTYNVSFTVTDGDGDSDSDNVIITVTEPAPFDFSVSAQPNNATVPKGNTTQTTVFVTLLSGTTQTVTLSHSGCPTNATCFFGTSSGNPTFNTTFTVATNTTTPNATYPITLTGSGGGLNRTATFTVTVL